MRIIGTLLFVVIALGHTSRLSAQTNEEVFEQFQWRLSTPGARTNAMGGAFTAAPDAAGAAVTNPAGLAGLSRPRVSFELRSDEGRVHRLAAIDSFVTGALTASRRTTNAVSFVDLAIPLRRNVTIALARHEFLVYRDAFHLPPRVLPGLIGTARALSPVDSDVDVRAVRYAASIGAVVHRRLRVGLSVSRDRLRARLLNTRHDIVVGSAAFDITETPIVTNQSRVDGADTGTGLIVGAIYQPVQALSVGFSLARAPRFTLSEAFELNPGRARGVNMPLVPQTGFPAPISLNVPTQVRAGIALHPHRRLRLAMDANHIKYSQLARGFTPVIAHDFVDGGDFTVADGTAVHVGGELNVGSTRTPVFLRAGLVTDPDHRVRFVGDVRPAGTVTAAQAQRANAISRSGFNLGRHGTEVRGTFGAGVAIGSRSTVDVAYVWKQQLVVSLGGRF